MVTEEHTASETSSYITRKESGQPISQTVLKAVAEVSNQAVIPDSSPSEGDGDLSLPPLYEAIDPDALNTIYQSATDTEIVATFTYCGYEVTVKSEGEVIVLEK